MWGKTVLVDSLTVALFDKHPLDARTHANGESHLDEQRRWVAGGKQASQFSSRLDDWYWSSLKRCWRFFRALPRLIDEVAKFLSELGVTLPSLPRRDLDRDGVEPLAVTLRVGLDQGLQLGCCRHGLGRLVAA